MPAETLHKALRRRTKERVVISDTTAPVPQEAKDAGVRATGTYIDYFLE